MDDPLRVIKTLGTAGSVGGVGVAGGVAVGAGDAQLPTRPAMVTFGGVGVGLGVPATGQPCTRISSIA